jgi:hypothetical protein
MERRSPDPREREARDADGWVSKRSRGLVRWLETEGSEGRVSEAWRPALSKQGVEEPNGCTQAQESEHSW